MKFPKLNVEEIFIGAMLQFPLYFIIGWWVVLVQLFCGLLWALGGAEGGSKLFRRIGVPSTVCVASWLATNHIGILLAIPFMVWFSPFSYGEDTWLFQLSLRLSNRNRLIANTLTRSITYIWYWVIFVFTLVLTARL
jgi:hypothetical protein